MAIAPPTRLPAAALGDLGDLVGGLRAYFDGGATRPLDWRRRQLKGVQAFLHQHESELLAALAADLGRPGIEAWLTELAHVRQEIDHILGHLGRWAAPERVPVRAILQPAAASIVAEPLGVVLVIAPWNYPVQLSLLPAAFALAAGNAVVIKPSEISAATTAVIARHLPDHVDPSAVAVVEGDAETATGLLAQRFDHIFYTGNGAIGRVVMRAAAEHLTPVTLELGGKSPVIVDRSANLSVAARRVAWGKWLNAGQTCIAPDYVLVDRAVATPFVDAVAHHTQAFYGPDPQVSSDYSRIVTTRHWDRLRGLLDRRVRAAIALGGTGDRATRYLAPTVLTDVGWDEPVMQEEIFGPILPIIPVDGPGDAISQVNRHDKPLSLYVFSEDRAVAHRVVAETSSGTVGVNVTLLQVAVPGLPFGGVGASGMGAYHGRVGFDTFTHRKGVLRRPTGFDPPATYPPYTRLKQWLLRRAY